MDELLGYAIYSKLCDRVKENHNLHICRYDTKGICNYHKKNCLSPHFIAGWMLERLLKDATEKNDTALIARLENIRSWMLANLRVGHLRSWILANRRLV